MSAPQTTPPRSKFARMLAADPKLAAKCEEVVQTLRRAASEEIRASEASQMLGPNDNVIINARADSMLA